MAFKITDFNGIVTAPGGDYPYGQIVNDPNGTRADVTSNGDLQQFFQRIMAEAGITPNSLPDNVSNGFQLVQALNTLYCRRFSGLAAGFGAPTGTYSTPIVMSGLTPVSEGFSAGFVFYNGIFYFVPAFVNTTEPGPGDSIAVLLSTADAQPVGTGSIVPTVANDSTKFFYATVIQSPILTLQTQVATLNTEVAIGAFAAIASPGTGWSAISHANDGKGRVYLAGIATYAGGGTAVIGTLPAGSRPGFSRRYVGSYQTGSTITAAVFEILSSGTVSLLLPGSGFSVGDLAYVDGIVFINGY